MDSFPVRPHQNRRRKLDEYLSQDNSQGSHVPVHSLKIFENLQIFHKLKHKKLMYEYDQPTEELFSTSEEDDETDTSEREVPCFYKWEKKSKEVNVETIYKEVNAYLGAIRAENRCQRKREHELNPDPNSEMIIEECSLEPEPESEMVTEAIDRNAIQIQEFYEMRNKFLYELWVSRNNVIREE